MFIVIDADGSLTRHPGPVSREIIEQIVGPPGFDFFPLRHKDGLSGFVNDDGLYHLDERPLNVIAGAICATYTGRPQMIAGKLVIAGGLRRGVAEISDLTADEARFVERIHHNVERALAGEVISYVGADEWSDNVRRYAAFVAKQGTGGARHAQPRSGPTVEFLRAEHLATCIESAADRMANTAGRLRRIAADVRATPGTETKVAFPYAGKAGEAVSEVVNLLPNMQIGGFGQTAAEADASRITGE